MFFLLGDVTNLEGDNHEDFSCSFDHESTPGIIIDLICFQFPLLVTIFINIYSYTKGIYVLKNSPGSVIARQMKRAGGYLFVLLITCKFFF